MDGISYLSGNLYLHVTLIICVALLVFFSTKCGGYPHSTKTHFRKLKTEYRIVALLVANYVLKPLRASPADNLNRVAIPKNCYGT
jgi:hypothetical protein